MEMQHRSPNVMMPALKTLECSLTTGTISGKTLIIEALSVQVLSSLSEGDDYDFGHELAPSDASKFSHMTEEEMPIATSEMKLPLEETVTTEGIFFYPNHHFSFSSNLVLTLACFNTCLYDIRRGCRY